MATIGSCLIAMEDKSYSFLIENPFNKKIGGNVNLSLHTPIPTGGSDNMCSFKGDDNYFRQKTRSSYENVLERNEDREFKCPYNCPEMYAHKNSYLVVRHVKKRHNPAFNLQIFDPVGANLDAWIPPKSGWESRKKCVDVFTKNEGEKFECPFNCPEGYVNKKGALVIQHIKARHDKTFNLQTFDSMKVDLDTYIPWKKNAEKMAERDMMTFLR